MAVKCRHANITLGSPLASSCCGIELFLLLTLSLGICHWCCWGKRLDELVVHASCVCTLVTGELSKGAQAGTCVYTTPDPKELGGLARLSIWQGWCVTLVPLPKEPLDQDSQQR